VRFLAQKIIFLMFLRGFLKIGHFLLSGVPAYDFLDFRIILRMLSCVFLLILSACVFFLIVFL